MFSQSNYKQEKCIMQLEVTFYPKGTKTMGDHNEDIFYDSVCTDLLGNKLDDEDTDVVEFEQNNIDHLRSFTIKKSMLVFSIRDIFGDLSFDDYPCGLSMELDNLSMEEILGIDEPDGLYYLAKDIVPLLKDHIKNAKDKNEIVRMSIPTVWHYASWIEESYEGWEGDSEYYCLGVLDINSLALLDIDEQINHKVIDFDLSKWNNKND